jgi:hypothetical protein
MKLSEIKLVDLKSRLDSLKKDDGVDSFLGSAMTTKGVFVLLFSTRFNRDYPVLVAGTDVARVLTQIFESLSLPPTFGDLR